METQERQYVLDHLGSSETHILKLVDGLTPGQWNFKETPERWSIADVVEHCIAVENGILGGVQRALTKPAELEKKAGAPTREGMVKAVGTSRNFKMTAPEPFQPKGRFPDTAELVAEMRKVRAASVAFAQETDAALRDHFFPHPVLGDLDGYQWLVVLSQHSARHALQIEEIKADPQYPR